jgi:hypothetical protein
MSEREFAVEITETDLSLLMKLIERYQKTCSKNARMARENGFGSGNSLAKADNWDFENERADALKAKLLENAN